MKYKELFGHVEYDDQAKIFHGEIVGLKGVITFQGTTVEEPESSFQDSIEVYLSLCKNPASCWTLGSSSRLLPQYSLVA